MSSPTESSRNPAKGTKAVTGQAAHPVTLTEPVRQPFNAPIFFAFLEGRVVPGIESVSARRYRRRIGDSVWIEAELAGRELRIRLPGEVAPQAPRIAYRLRRLFDLGADPETIDRHLAGQPKLEALVKAEPGVRVPGVWDPFEGAVRAVLGQQVSVARATNLAAALCERFGDGGFPDAETLADAEVAAIGLPGIRGRAISAIARRVADEGVGWLEDAESLRDGFVEIPGLGPWTAEYAAMRVSRDPDAFPDTDWGVVKALGLKGAQVRRWAEPCRPWRAYAVMHLWCSRAA